MKEFMEMVVENLLDPNPMLSRHFPPGVKVKTVIVGAPRSGKSTYARSLRERGIPTYCTDPKSLVKEPEDGVTYLPEGLGWSESSQYVLDEWFSKPGPWVIEGIATVRALRKLFKDKKLNLLKGMQIVKTQGQIQDKVTKQGQIAMGKAIDSVWREVDRSLRRLDKDKYGFRVKPVDMRNL